jgi:hypothetical protein
MMKHMIKKMAIALSLSTGFGLGATASATTPISPQDWNISGSTSQGGAEWLTLTNSNKNQLGNVQSKKTYGPNESLKIEFDYVSWAGTGADGLALYLFDADVDSAGTQGRAGGALGYCGLKGAYVGIGLDQYGTFTQGECKYGRQELMRSTNGAVIRGSEARGYAFEGNFPIGAQLDCMTCGSREEAINAGFVKHVVAELNSRQISPAGYTINLWVNGEAVIQGAEYLHWAPRLMKVGVSGATGDAYNTHEIRNLQVSSSHDECVD